MPRLYLDYQGSNRPSTRLGLLVLLVGLIAMPLAVDRYLDARQQQEEAESVLEKLGRAALKPSRTAATATPTEEMQAAREATRHLALPWTALFQAIEHTNGRDVALLGIETDPSRNEIKLSGEARNPTAMLDYVRRLKSQPEFGHVDLQSHQIEAEDRDKPVSFVLVVQWKVGA